MNILGNIMENMSNTVIPIEGVGGDEDAGPPPASEKVREREKKGRDWQPSKNDPLQPAAHLLRKIVDERAF